MNLIEMSIEEIMLLSINSFYIMHKEDDVIQTCRVIEGTLEYYNTEDDEWSDWSPYDVKKTPKQNLEGFMVPFKTYILDKE